ncbi:MAG: hypothetical protein QM722_22350 [Piscinibacter sp.]
MQSTQDLVLEFARLGIVYVHLIACCVAIGLVLTSDLAMVRQLFNGDLDDKLDDAHLTTLKNTVAVALGVLWLSGLAVVLLDSAAKGWQYFANPKLQAKIAIVVLLTINGIVLHHRVLPWIRKAGSLLRLSYGQSLLATLTGAVSGVSWFYAAMLGVGRPLSWKYSLAELMFAYPLLILAGFFGMLMLVSWAKYRDSGEREAFQHTRVIALDA